MALQPYKIEYINQKGNNCELFFVDRAFESALKQANAFIERNRKLFTIKLYHKNIHSQFNFGWKWMGSYSNQ